MTAEICDGCGVDLSVRKVLRTVRSPTVVDRVVRKRVVVRPVQVVLYVSVQGSLATELPPPPPENSA